MLPAAKTTSSLALLYIAAEHLTTGARMQVIENLVHNCYGRSILSMMVGMQDVMRTQNIPVTMALLVPSYIVQGVRAQDGKKKFTIEHVSTRSIVTFGSGKQRKEINYKNWLALSSQSDHTGDLQIGALDIMSPCVQLVDVIKSPCLVNFKIYLRHMDYYNACRANAQLCATTTEPELTARLLERILQHCNSKVLTDQGFTRMLVALLQKHSFLGCLTVQLKFSNCQVIPPIEEKLGIYALREAGRIKAFCSHSHAQFVHERDPFTAEA
jgi:hypothetical protein